MQRKQTQIYIYSLVSYKSDVSLLQTKRVFANKQQKIPDETVEQRAMQTPFIPVLFVSRRTAVRNCRQSIKHYGENARDEVRRVELTIFKFRAKSIYKHRLGIEPASSALICQFAAHA